MGIFADRLKELRIEKGKNLTEMADFLEISIQSYSAYEGTREPKYEYLTKLANYFDVSTDYLLGTSDARKADNESAMKQLGLTEKAIDSLTKIYAAHKHNTFTLAVNALVEHWRALYCISRYLYWRLPPNENFEAEVPVYPYDLVSRYSSGEKDYKKIEDLVDADISTLFVTEEINKDLQMMQIEENLKDLLQVENSLERLPPNDEYSW